MFKKERKSLGKPANAITKKSHMSMSAFNDKLEEIRVSVSAFSRFSGIARSTITGWNDNQIPLYAQRALELMEIKTRIFNMYENNTDNISKKKSLKKDSS